MLTKAGCFSKIYQHTKLQYHVMFLQFTTVNNNSSKGYQGEVASNSMFIEVFTKNRQSASIIMGG